MTSAMLYHGQISGTTIAAAIGTISGSNLVVIPDGTRKVLIVRADG